MSEFREYRDNVEQLLAFCERHNSGGQLMTAKQVAEFCGRDVRTVRKRYDIPTGGITIATLARRMCL